jgi:hypothetical protein
MQIDAARAARATSLQLAVDSRVGNWRRGDGSLEDQTNAEVRNQNADTRSGNPECRIETMWEDSGHGVAGHPGGEGSDDGFGVGVRIYMWFRERDAL